MQKASALPKTRVKRSNGTVKPQNRGSIEAQYNLGLCYHEGSGVAQDVREAVKWYRKGLRRRALLPPSVIWPSATKRRLRRCEDTRKAFQWYRRLRPKEAPLNIIWACTISMA